VDGGSLTFTVVSSPAHGVLTGSAPNLPYSPAANYNGSDEFTFKVSDGVADATALVSIAVTAVNDAPVANPQAVTTTQGTAKAITLTGSDVDGNPLAYAVVTGPANGALSGAAPALTYTPNAGYSGTDSFTFKVNDGTVDSPAATVSITVNASGPTTVFFDNFETALGWTVNPSGSDTATLGKWERANPESTSSSGTKQQGTTVSGSYDLVTGPLAGSSAGAYDVDGGVTTVRSPNIALPAGKNLTLTFSYYMAHLNNSSSADYLRVKVVGATTTTVLHATARGIEIESLNDLITAA
jgi:aminopeptidase S